MKRPVYILSPRKILNRQSVTLFPEDTSKDVKQTPANPRNAPTKERKRHAVQGSLRIHLHLSSALDPQARWSSRESLRSPFLRPLLPASHVLFRKRLWAASVLAHVTSHLIATARGSALYAVVAYYTTGLGIHTGLQLQKCTPRSTCTTEQRPAENVRRLSLSFSRRRRLLAGTSDPTLRYLFEKILLRFR